MKKYIGTKVIMAEPMTLEDAQKVLDREIKPSSKENDGYLVEYKDGYKSWSPKSVFEEAHKPCETFLDRLTIERNELMDKIVSLNVAFQKEGFREKVGDYQYGLLKKQLSTMTTYSAILLNRLIDLTVEKDT